MSVGSTVSLSPGTRGQSRVDYVGVWDMGA